MRGHPTRDEEKGSAKKHREMREQNPREQVAILIARPTTKANLNECQTATSPARKPQDVLDKFWSKGTGRYGRKACLNQRGSPQVRPPGEGEAWPRRDKDERKGGP